MTTPTIPTRRKPQCKMAFHVQREPYLLRVANRMHQASGPE
jgi:hypothetical protein